MTRITPIRNATQHSSAGPYSPALAVSAGDIVVLSGQGPLDDRGAVVGADIREQTRITLDNARRILALAGADLSHVFKVNAYLADLDDWDEFNAEYVAHFPEPRPVRTTVGVKLLLGMKVEIELWAAR
ncbi:RidA family protein [Microbacterium sulfonylureivorans]|uniref:RidA family protein n=1 Tax=Microbacterium sulfonylureivorans TaxID=2486854 RepID=UPI000FD840E2|nr:RidA family protein [Microbacterium sulfonylureivorans]